MWYSALLRRGRPGGRSRPRSSGRCAAASLFLEALEGRWVPTTVTNLLNSGPGSLRQALLDTPSGGTVDFQPGLSGTIVLTTSQLTINRDLTIAGPGADVLTVSGNNARRAFEVAATATVTLSGLTIANGRVTGTNGGGILNQGALTVTASTLSDNTAIYSGGGGNGGGIFNSGELTVTASTLSGNSAGFQGGGGIYNSSTGALTVTASTLSGNAGDIGGGIFNSGVLTVTASTLSGNTTRFAGGGGIHNTGVLTVTASTLSDNAAAGAGGGILNQGMLTVTASTLSGNTASQGGGIDNNINGVMTITASTLSDNAATGNGGGLSNWNTLTVTDSTLSGNAASQGGGIYNINLGALTVTASTLSGNAASRDGGGIYIYSGTVTVTDSTLSGNFATDSGGGIYHGILNSSALTVTDSTLSGNAAQNSGGGIYRSGGSVMARNTLVATNIASSAPDVRGVLASQGYNLIGDGTGGSGFHPTDLVGTAKNLIDPLLGPLQDNGGPTFTHALLPGSPALDAGNNADAPEFDQRGLPRVTGPRTDIGAYEVQPGPAAFFYLAAPESAVAGAPFDLYLFAYDADGYLATTYTGTVAFFSTTDPDAQLPEPYPFTAADAGVAYLPGSAVLYAEGLQEVGVYDVETFALGVAYVEVFPGAAPGGAPNPPAGPGGGVGNDLGAVVAALRRSTANG